MRRPSFPCPEGPARRRRASLRTLRIGRAGASAHGFTLIEVTVALTIAAVVVLAAGRIFSGVLDGSRALVAAREALDRDANARRWLKATFLSLDPPFEGRTDRASFTSWQLVAGGWFEPSRVELTREGARLVARGGGDPLVLADSVTSLAFDYLLEPGADSKWVREWISPVSAPVVIRVRLGRARSTEHGAIDTLLFLVKERG